MNGLTGFWGNEPVLDLRARPTPKTFGAPRDFLIAGVDFGQRQDPPALVMFAKPQGSMDVHLAIDPRVKLAAVRQWPLNLDYTVLCDEILGYGADALVVEVNGPGAPMLDMLRKQARALEYRGRIHGVFTAGSNVRPQMNTDNLKGKRVTIPKDQLVWAINKLIRRNTYVVCDRCGKDLPATSMGCFGLIRNKRTNQERPCDGKGVQRGGGLLIPDGMMTAWKLVVEQAKTFDMSMTTRGTTKMDGHHGDLVLSAGFAAWWMNAFFPEFGTRREASMVRAM